MNTVHPSRNCLVAHNWGIRKCSSLLMRFWNVSDRAYISAKTNWHCVVQNLKLDCIFGEVAWLKKRFRDMMRSFVIWVEVASLEKKRLSDSLEVARCVRRCCLVWRVFEWLLEFWFLCSQQDVAQKLIEQKCNVDKRAPGSRERLWNFRGISQFQFCTKLKISKYQHWSWPRMKWNMQKENPWCKNALKLLNEISPGALTIRIHCGWISKTVQSSSPAFLLSAIFVLIRFFKYFTPLPPKPFAKSIPDGPIPFCLWEQSSWLLFLFANNKIKECYHLQKKDPEIIFLEKVKSGISDLFCILWSEFMTRWRGAS